MNTRNDKAKRRSTRQAKSKSRSIPAHKQTFTQLMEAEHRGLNGKSDGKLFEALTRWVMSTQAPWANQLEHVVFTPANNPGCDLWGYYPDFSKIDAECKDYFNSTLILEQVKGLITQNRNGHDKVLFTSANELSAEAEKACEAHHITVYARPYFEALGERIGGFPARAAIMEFSSAPAPTKAITLNPHQVELSDDLTAEVRLNQVAWLGAPTQTGKTYTLMATLEKLGAKRITWGIPTLALKDSIVADLSRLQIKGLRIGVVGSEPATGSTWLKSLEDIIAFTSDPAPFVIVYVTASAHKLRDALINSDQSVDASVIDEIHQMTGRVKERWAALEIPSTYRIGATATFSSISAKKRALCEKHGWQWSAMDNTGEHNYGKGIVMSPAEARERDLAVPAQLVLTQTDSAELADWIQRSPKLRTMLADKVISGQDAQVGFVLTQAIHAIGARKTMLSVNTKVAARGTKIAIELANKELNSGPLKVYFLHGGIRQTRRQHILWEFQHNSNPCVLIQINCVGVGITLHGLDSVAYGQPRQATDSLVQNFGRAAGQAFGEGATRKTHYHIILPIVIGPGETGLDAILASRFVTIVNTASEYNDDKAGQLIHDMKIVGRPGAKITRHSHQPGPDPVYSATPEEIKALTVAVFETNLQRQWVNGPCQATWEDEDGTGSCDRQAETHQNGLVVCEGHRKQGFRGKKYTEIGGRFLEGNCQVSCGCAKPAKARQNGLSVCGGHYSQGYKSNEYTAIDTNPFKQKLVNEKVSVIKLRLANGDNCAALGREYGVHKSTISQIQTGKRYADVPMAPPGTKYAALSPPSYKTKLTRIQVSVIKRRLCDGETNSALAREYEVSPEAISAIKSGRTYASVPMAPPTGKERAGNTHVPDNKPKLTNEKVGVIKLRLHNGETGVALAREYGVSNSTISQIQTGKRYADVPMAPAA